MRPVNPFVIATTALYLAFTATAFAQSLPNNKWFKVCEGKACITEYRLSKHHVKFMIRNDPTIRDPILAIAPWWVGVDLPFGMTWQIDDGKSIRVPFLRCTEVACTAQVILNDKYIAALRAGSVYHLGATRDGKNRVIDVPLKGFAAAYDGKQLMTLDEYVAAGGASNP